MNRNDAAHIPTESLIFANQYFQGALVGAACWRSVPGTKTWTRRCGPVPTHRVEGSPIKRAVLLTRRRRLGVKPGDALPGWPLCPVSPIGGVVRGGVLHATHPPGVVDEEGLNVLC
jgi:hypothetical protein